MSERILISGATGFIGQELGIYLVRAGHDVTVLVRHAKKALDHMSFPCRVVEWNSDGSIPESEVNAHSVIINLAGESVVKSKWNASGLKAMLDSRVNPTKHLVAFAKKSPSTKVFLQASAVGYYGDRADEILTESSEAGSGILAETCKQWERECDGLQGTNIRTCIFRIGPVLGQSGGALPDLDRMYASGMGSSLGNGKHYFPWIHIEDICRLFLAAIENAAYVGVFNATAPEPCTYNELNEAIAAQKGVRTIPAPPKAMIKLLFGKKSEFLLASERVIPQRAFEQGFAFRYRSIRDALKDLYQGQIQRGAHWLVRKQWIAKTPEELWPYFANEHNLEELTPPFLNFRVLGKSTQNMEEGTLIDYRMKFRGFPVNWQTRIEVWKPTQRFVDTQKRGPYKLWHHTHLFEKLGSGTLMTDRVQYKLPLGFLGTLGSGWYVHKDVAKIFSFRMSSIAKKFGNKST